MEEAGVHREIHQPTTSLSLTSLSHKITTEYIFLEVEVFTRKFCHDNLVNRYVWVTDDNGYAPFVIVTTHSTILVNDFSLPLNYQQNFNISDMMGATSGAGSNYPSMACPLFSFLSRVLYIIVCPFFFWSFVLSILV